MHTHTHTHTHAHTSSTQYTCTCTRTHMHMHIHIHKRVQTHGCILWTHIHMQTRAHMYMHNRIHTHKHTWQYMHKHTHKDTHVHTHLHTHVHTHTQAHWLSPLCLRALCMCARYVCASYVRTHWLFPSLRFVWVCDVRVCVHVSNVWVRTNWWIFPTLPLRECVRIDSPLTRSVCVCTTWVHTDFPHPCSSCFCVGA